MVEALGGLESLGIDGFLGQHGLMLLEIIGTITATIMKSTKFTWTATRNDW